MLTNNIRADILNDRLGLFEPELVTKWRHRCRPRLLVVTDGSLSFNEASGFGLWRFIHAITHAAGVTNKPIIKLAHRSFHAATVTVESDTYQVDDSFNFASAAPAVTRAEYDQIWLFGISSSGSLSSAELDVLSEFMNAGGGVFATGDHQTLGRTMCGALPRIRHMREWEDIPMGLENDVTVAVNRIDTVVDPGSNGLYEFEDQSDSIPQRIYPNYAVTQASATEWQATIHPVLRLPGAPNVRQEAAGSAGFTQDVDVLPDHPHESVCYEVTNPAVLSGSYKEANQNFPEFQPAVADPAIRVGAEIVAYAVSGGRSVHNGNWKPPVKPQMFGVISAYDGRRAQPYTGQTQRPGRIVCESTWHHYVNVNLDGRSTSRSALGTWSGGSPGLGTFTPSASLNKIYAYYRNTVAWLQPANRVWCYLWWDLVSVRFNPALLEELMLAPRLESFRDFVGAGREAARLIADARGPQALEETLEGALLGDPRAAALADAMRSGELRGTGIDLVELRHGMLGAMLVQLAQLLPDDEPKAVDAVMERGPEAHAQKLTRAALNAARQGIDENNARIKRAASAIKSLEKTLAKAVG